MKIPLSCLAFALAFLCICSSQKAAAQAPNPGFSPKKADHIILLGNTFADRMRHYGYFETQLQSHFTEKELTMRNMGWSADEVGLQPRPLNFPGFGEKTTRLTEGQKEINFKSFTHETEKIVMPVALNFAGLNQDLRDQKADIIFLCFGMNEAFKGAAGLPEFEKDLNVFIKNLLSNQYNGRSAPTLILVSPIAHENLSEHYPDPAEHNKNLALYTKAMQKAASVQKLYFIDLFTPSLAKMQAKNQTPLTINGIHLNDAGYRLAAEWMAQSLGFGGKPDFDSYFGKKLREVVKMKDAHFFYRWRAVNGEYIYGRRREPFGVIAFPPELRKLNQMTAALDSVIWELAKTKNVNAYQKALDIVDRRGKPADPTLVTDIPMTGRQGEAAKKIARQENLFSTSTEKFTLPKGYEINLFASEKDFPIEKPVAMNFDAKGRLWVATMPTYPQYFPGIPVHDKIVILEDTDGDGKADKHTIFADDLYLPLGYEFGNGGVFVSQEPDILFLKDTDGDGKADVKEVILSGFGSEDSHHATHAFTYGQDGALYFNEGTFLNTQVETPYGPVRSYAGATYRYEPRTAKLFHYISYPYYNPWGSIFDKWGTHLIGDASDGSNYFAPPMTGKVDYPDKHPRTEMFTETRVRPTAGIEIISSRNFPDDVQGDFLVNNNIGFQGTKQHRIIRDSSGIRGKERENLLQSSDPNFRPIDLEYGPDGGLYIADWYNPLISHGENPPRDPARDKSHGRIWRITYKEKPLLKPTDISAQSIPDLLENLKVYEDRFRYRTRIQLREKPASEVLPALKKWTAALDKNNPEYEHHLLEALWLYQDFDIVEPALLKTLLNAKEPQARAAATRVLRFWSDRIPETLTLMQTRLNDESPRVRLEAIVAMSFYENEKAVLAATDIFKYPTDRYLDYAISETFRHLKPVWLAALKQKKITGKAETYLLASLTAEELAALPKTPATLAAIRTKAEEAKQKADVAKKPANKDVTELVLNTIEAKMAFDKKEFQVPTGKKVILIFNNTDMMPHNVVIVKPGTEQKVGEAADAMANLKDGFEKNFIPNSADILFSTPLVNAGKSFRLEFTAPSQPGAYPFICSFPGHWRVMQGVVNVVDAKNP
ncbi:PVC-type heme-binding CxxCH protein [Dyadobacter luticola]|uniref:Azurin n=1 Tax=Dyadobacter luticola TaxID=1979387 RepID=A0A5R9L2B8_9BACT|nr:PVC-type heme-binding CxxCH protein [Dyadobacter luticola]TLV02722.1 azurin [Dyadobacter luticola]